MAKEPEKKRGKQKRENCPPGAPLWMITFSDLVTLLLTFFVLLLSMANMDEVKFNAAAKSMQDAFGSFSSPSKTEPKIAVLPSMPLTRYSPMPRQNAQQLYDKIQIKLESLRLNKDIDLLKKDENAIVLRVRDSIFFAPGAARLEPESYPVLRSIADIIRPLPLDLRIEGHTDDTPAAGNKYDKWNLSVARAVSVLRYYMQSNMLPLDRMSAVGYGADRPVAANTDEASKAKNRRVDFLLILQAKVNRPGSRNNIPF